MSLFDQLLALTRVALENMPGGRAIPVARAWAEGHGSLRDEPATIYGWAWATPAVRWFRVSLLDAGSRAQVFSALALPHPDWDLPLFGAEVVSISSLVTVVAYDWIPVAGRSSYLDALTPIRRELDHFPPGGDLPPWAAESFSPHALFSRPRGALPESEIRRAFEAYLQGYLSLVSSASPHGDPRETLAAQRRYCAEHFANDPGGSMLAKIFGAPWAEGYAREFLFRLADQPLCRAQPELPQE